MSRPPMRRERHGRTAVRRTPPLLLAMVAALALSLAAIIALLGLAGR